MSNYISPNRNGQQNLPELPALGKVETSREAAISLVGLPVNTVRRNIYLAVREKGERGATANEIERTTGLRSCTVSARFKELRDAGVIVRTNQKRKTESGRNAFVHVASDFQRGEEVADV